LQDSTNGMRAPVATGTVVAGFRVASLIGEGAMGSVYLAEDAAGGRVALKLLAPELARDERFRRRFLRESQLAASLDHPNIVRTIAAGEDDGVLYIAMEHIEGSDLRDLLRREGRLEPERALHLVDQVAGALDEAHAAGLVHRDVKPGNVLVDGEHAYVCDFGLARHVSSVSSLTGERGFVGTIDYVPPEQIEGGSLDGRADQYSLGCVLFECLAGARPFDRDSELSVVFAHLNEPPPRLSDFRADLPAAFDEVFATVLAKAPGGRYDTCSELAAAARAALQGRTFGRRRSRRRLAVAVASLGVALAATVGALFAFRGGETPATSAARPTAVLSAGSLNLISATTRRVVGHVRLGGRLSSQQTPFDVVAGHRAAWVLDVAGQRLVRVNLGARRVAWAVHLPWVPSPRLALGGGFLFVRQDGDVGVLEIDARTGRILRRWPVSGGNGVGMAFGAGSLWLAQGDAIARIDPRSGRLVSRIVERPGQAGEADWLAFADGALWSVSASDGIVRKYDPEANQLVKQVTLHGWVSDLAVAGDVFVSIEQDGVVFGLSEDDLSVLGSRPSGLDPQRISADGGTIWVANAAGKAISSLSPLTGTRRELATNARPETIARRGGLLLAFAVAPPQPLPPIAGEQIRTSTPNPFLSPDPAQPRSQLDAEVSYATCAGLLGYPDAPGAAGGTLRPEVAAAMPTLSADGRTYTFRVLPGFRFSPPSNQPVTAATFKYTIERALSKPFELFGPSAVSDIAGEQAHLADTAKHISGIVARGDRLQITLVAPAGDFLRRLSTPYFCPVPVPTAVKPESVATPVPRDGRYYVASSTDNRTVLLRNPNYGGHRPRRPVRIVFGSGIESPEAVALTDRGELDFLSAIPFFGDPLVDIGGALDQRYGPGSAAARAGNERYLHRPVAAGDAVVLNASRPLFRDRRMRLAFEYAIDRTTLARTYGDLPAESIIPPAVPGFDTAHVYPLHPDLATARRLAGPGRRTAVLYYCTNGPFGGEGHRRVATAIRAELARIGIAVSITAPPCSPHNRYDQHSRRADLILATDFSPVAVPEEFMSIVLSRDSLGAALGQGLWTDPRFLARVKRAHALSQPAHDAAFHRLELQLLHAAPIAVFGSWYTGDYFAPRVGCRINPPGVGVLDLATLCRKSR
jgi:ABC-type transport system substrate-binding protein/predicted Ser/Thr protein kinase